MRTDNYEEIGRQHFNKLKNEYNTSYKNLVLITDCLTESAMTMYGRGDRKYTSRTMTILTLTFGVDPLWLMGLTENAYTNTSTRLAAEHYENKYKEEPYPKNNRLTPTAKGNLLMLRQLNKIFNENQKADAVKIKENKTIINKILRSGVEHYKL